MILAQLEKTIVNALEDIKAKDIELIDTSRHTAFFDRIVVASGESNRQTRALARHVQEKVREAGGEVIGIEGEETGEWVLVDLGDVVVHIMQPAVREHYRLEDLWLSQGSPRRKALPGNAFA
jgi:ribosome-associated protein